MSVFFKEFAENLVSRPTTVLISILTGYVVGLGLATTFSSDSYNAYSIIIAVACSIIFGVVTILLTNVFDIIIPKITITLNFNIVLTIVLLIIFFTVLPGLRGSKKLYDQYMAQQ